MQVSLSRLITFSSRLKFESLEADGFIDRSIEAIEGKCSILVHTSNEEQFTLSDQMVELLDDGSAIAMIGDEKPSQALFEFFIERPLAASDIPYVAKDDHGLSAEQLDDKYNPDGGGQHPEFTRAMWREEVANERVYCGYWAWCEVRVDEEVEGTEGRDNV